MKQKLAMLKERCFTVGEFFVFERNNPTTHDAAQKIFEGLAVLSGFTDVRTLCHDTEKNTADHRMVVVIQAAEIDGIAVIIGPSKDGEHVKIDDLKPMDFHEFRESLNAKVQEEAQDDPTQVP